MTGTARRALIGAVALLLFGCGTNPPTSKISTRAEAEPARPAFAPRERSKKLPPGTPVTFESELEEVQAARQLRLRAPVVGRTISRDVLVRHLEEGFHADLPTAAIDGAGELLIAFGAAPLDFNYEAAVLALLRRDLAGLYDPRLGAMFLREELDGEARRAALLHELVHALQDQHYGLRDITQYREDGGDRTSALSCLAEGDATSAMFDSLLAPHGRTALDLPDELIAAQFARAAEPSAGSDAAPALLRRSVLAPYVDGLAFVQALRRRGGFAEVDRVWKNPPTTTEQVLHLDKYDSHEPARDVPLPRPPVHQTGQADFEIVFHDVCGEQSVRLLLEEWMTTAAAARAAQGWGGDRVAVFARGNERAVGWILESDDAPSAEALFAALGRALGDSARRWGPAVEPTICRIRTDRGPFAVGHRAKRVVVVAGPRAKNGPAATRGTTSTPSCSAAHGWITTLLDQP